MRDAYIIPADREGGPIMVRFSGDGDKYEELKFFSDRAARDFVSDFMWAGL
jgi:hypothetical protein